MLAIYYWTFVFAYFAILALQLYYLSTGSLNAVEIYIMIITNIFVLLFFWSEQPVNVIERELPEYISFGTSMHDAMYGRKYNYDLIVEHAKSHKNTHNVINN